MHTQWYLNFLSLQFSDTKILDCLNIVCQKEIVSGWFWLIFISALNQIQNCNTNYGKTWLIRPLQISEFKFKYEQSEQLKETKL